MTEKTEKTEKKKLDPNKCIHSLRRNGIRVDTQKNIIFIGKRGDRTIGLKLWRYIDCLCGHHEFNYTRAYN